MHDPTRVFSYKYGWYDAFLRNTQERVKVLILGDKFRFEFDHTTPAKRNWWPLGMLMCITKEVVN
jgi:hypothetical protein